MWLTSLRILFVTLVLLTTAENAFAQTQDQSINGTLPAPSETTLNNNGTLYAQQVAPAPQIAPLLTPAQQMAQQNRNNTATNGQTAGNQVNGLNNGSVNGLNTNNLNNTQGNSLADTLNNTQANNFVPATATSGAGTTDAISAAANAAAANARNATTTPAQGTATAASDPGAAAIAAGSAASAVATAVTPEVRPSNTTGFSPVSTGANIPMGTGTMPMTNAGMNMNIDPNVVGGVGTFDPNMPPSPTNPVPYEVQLEQRNHEIQEKARGMAFEQAKKSVLPMETYEIRDVLGRLKDTQEAIQSPVRPAPTPENVIQTVSTDPAAKPQTIMLAAGNVTTMNIVDITGEPWPIVDIGFGGAFDVKPPEAGGHVIRITPLKDFAHGNLVVRLLKLTTPITFTLQAGGDVVNYRFDARIPENGPNAKMPIISGGIKTMAGDKVMTSFLEGATPEAAEKMAVDGVDGRTNAYRFGGSMYIRTPLSLLSPAWQSSATSADGMNIYMVNDAPPVILLSDKGSLVRARISDAKKSDNGF